MNRDQITDKELNLFYFWTVTVAAAVVLPAAAVIRVPVFSARHQLFKLVIFCVVDLTLYLIYLRLYRLRVGAPTVDTLAANLVLVAIFGLLAALTP